MHPLTKPCRFESVHCSFCGTFLARLILSATSEPSLPHSGDEGSLLAEAVVSLWRHLDILFVIILLYNYEVKIALRI